MKPILKQSKFDIPFDYLNHTSCGQINSYYFSYRGISIDLFTSIDAWEYYTMDMDIQQFTYLISNNFLYNNFDERYYRQHYNDFLDIITQTFFNNNKENNSDE